MNTKRLNSRRSSFTEDDDFDQKENSNKLSTTKKKSYKKWTKDEDDRLRETIDIHAEFHDWSKISKYVGNGRTDAQCQHRWERFLDPSITKGPWTDEEDKRVIELVRDYGARHWSLIAKELKGRVGKQCRERWHNHLNPLINKNPWTNEDNLRLFILHQHFGNKWAEIAKYFNGRSDNSIKNHWNSSMKKKFHLEVENLKNQGLDWTALIPSDFPWPKIDRSSRTPLATITNRRLSTIKKPMMKDNHQISLSNSNEFHSSSNPHFNIHPDLSQSISVDLLANQSSDDFQHLFYDTPLSPLKPLPMLSSCADSQPSNSESIEHLFLFDSKSSFPSMSSPHLSLLSSETNLLANDDFFLVKCNENIIVSPRNLSNNSSPSKYRILNTPERSHLYRLTPSPKRDCFNEYLPFPEPILSEYYSSIRSNKYDLNKTLPDAIGYHPTYTEILIGQTRDQRYVTEQARRYLSSS